MGIRPVLKSPKDNVGERGENKTRANISPYTGILKISTLYQNQLAMYDN